MELFPFVQISTRVVFESGIEAIDLESSLSVALGFNFHTGGLDFAEIVYYPQHCFDCLNTEVIVSVFRYVFNIDN